MRESSCFLLSQWESTAVIGGHVRGIGVGTNCLRRGGFSCAPVHSLESLLSRSAFQQAPFCIVTTRSPSFIIALWSALGLFDLFAESPRLGRLAAETQRSFAKLFSLRQRHDDACSKYFFSLRRD